MALFSGRGSRRREPGRGDRQTAIRQSWTRQWTPASTGGGPDVASDTPIGDGGGVDTFINPGEFGAPCSANTDCLSGWCVVGPEGLVCTKICDLVCPDDWECKQVLTEGADLVFLCIQEVVQFCTPCQADFQCNGGTCLTIEDVSRCAPSCTDDQDCADGYGCREDEATTGVTGLHCLPNGGSCDCVPENDGGVRTCRDENVIGTCYGIETCNPGVGWEGCTALEPTAEVCDGVDNDCNFLIDDGVAEGDPCTNDTVDGSCDGISKCSGALGTICLGPIPQAEACDFEDNDCDGEVDEDFKDVDGNWTLNNHCGTCGNTCVDNIPNGVGVCGGDVSSHHLRRRHVRPGLPQDQRLPVHPSPQRDLPAVQ